MNQTVSFDTGQNPYLTKIFLSLIPSFFVLKHSFLILRGAGRILEEKREERKEKKTTKREEMSKWQVLIIQTNFDQDAF